MAPPKFESEDSSESDDSVYTKVFKEIRRMESEEEFETLVIILAMLAVFIATSCGMFCLFALYQKRRDGSSKSHLPVYSCEYLTTYGKAQPNNVIKFPGPVIMASSAPPMEHPPFPNR